MTLYPLFFESKKFLTVAKREKLLGVMFTVLILALIHWIYWSYFPMTESDSREWVCEEDLYKIKRGLSSALHWL